MKYYGKNSKELNTLKNQYEALTNKLKELNEEELNEVIGGIGHMGKGLCVNCNQDPNTCITKKCNGFCPKESQLII